jgi:aspartyl-tRNA(Asn)/glutamyl-tRNA(Gln) amidotransferase subunit A
MDDFTVAVKDNICTMDMPVTCSSKMLENFTPPYDATVIERLRSTCKITKSPMREFNLGQGANGIAKAVKSGEARFGLDSDTDGSIRRDAAEFGLVGYKPSYGAVSRFGLIASAGSFDQIGAVTHTVADAAFLISTVCGHDEKDSTTNPNFKLNCQGLDGFDIKSAKVGVLGKAESLAEAVQISVPTAKYSLLAHNIIAYAEVSSNLSRFDGIRFGHRSSKSADSIDDLYTNSRTEGFGLEVQKNIIIGTYLLSAGNYEVYYKKARILQAMLRDELAAAFEKCDFIITPCSDSFFVLANLAGLPAISLPCGNIHILGRRFDDENLLRFAEASQTHCMGNHGESPKASQKNEVSRHA